MELRADPLDEPGEDRLRLEEHLRDLLPAAQVELGELLSGAREGALRLGVDLDEAVPDGRFPLGYRYGEVVAATVVVDQFEVVELEPMR